MTKTTLLFLADAFAALAAIATKHADGYSPAPEPLPENGASAETDKPKRGRPPKSITTEAPATPPVETPAQPEPPKEEKTAEQKPNLAEIRKEAAKPLIQGGQGKEVKALLEKYKVSNISSIADSDHESFLNDIEALAIAG